MAASTRKITSIVAFLYLVFVFLFESVTSSDESTKSVQTTTQPTSNIVLTPKLSFQIKVHGFLLWASFGFLMPVGILMIRMSQRIESAHKVNVLFYSHVIIQTLAVLLATIAAILSIKKFENTFSNTHQKIGLPLYVLLWIQPLTGFCRPNKGAKKRRIWYFVHWVLGTGITIAGTVDVYIGLLVYHMKTSRDLNIWILLFTVEIVTIALIYLLQDRWNYMKSQGVNTENLQIRSNKHLTYPGINNQKKLGELFQLDE